MCSSIPTPNMSQLLEGIRRLRRLARAQRASGSLAWAQLLERHGIDVRTSPCERRAEGLFFPCLGTVVFGPGESVLLSGFERAARLHAAGVQFEASPDTVRARVGSFRVNVETAQELHILEEIYLQGTYHFDLSGPLLIFDIGMNTAYSALYLAAMHPEAVICAYEPFTPTFRRAEVNIALNPKLAQAIRPFGFGLADADQVIDIEYNDQWRASIGVYGVPT